MAEDRSGPVLVNLLQAHFACAEAAIVTRIVRDEVADIQSAVKEHCSYDSCELVVLTGGTGLSPRDVTPEALFPLFDKRAPGIEALLLSKSLEVTPMAALARYTAGIRGNVLILALPGSPKAARECFGFVAKVLTHAIATICGVQHQVKATHTKMQQSHATADSKPITSLTPSSSDSHHCHCVAPTTTIEPWTGPLPTAIIASPAARNRQSPYPLISLHDAYKVLDAFCQVPLMVVDIEVRDSLGHVLAQDVHAQWDMPPFRASIKVRSTRPLPSWE
jgi:gephyrin